MRLIFICKASTEIGFGHLIRARSLANSLIAYRDDIIIQFVLIGESNLLQLLHNASYPVQVIRNENEISIGENYDAAILDMLETTAEFLSSLAMHVRLTVSLSPVFNHFSYIDILFHRTKYLNLKGARPKQIYSGIDYTIIQENCKRISTGQYDKNLHLEYFPVAISMGGGDAANLTLECLHELKKCKVPATFWVLLGEGYKFSYDELVAEIRNDSFHEILLVKTNKSMWQVLENCLLMIIPGGITAYEAAYAGIPTLILNRTAESDFLVKELSENQVSFSFQNWVQIKEKLEELYHKRKELMLMHIHSKDLINGKAHEEIFKKLQDSLKSK